MDKTKEILDLLSVTTEKALQAEKKYPYQYILVNTTEAFHLALFYADENHIIQYFAYESSTYKGKLEEKLKSLHIKDAIKLVEEKLYKSHIECLKGDCPFQKNWRAKLKIISAKEELQKRIDKLKYAIANSSDKFTIDNCKFWVDSLKTEIQNLQKEIDEFELKFK